MSDAAAFRALLRSEFRFFMRRCAPTLGVQFMDNWHLEAIAWHLDQVRLGHIRRLIINMPPRSLKSIAASVAFPAYVLGLNPAARLICISYAAELAAKHGNDFRAIVEADWYRKAFDMRIAPGRNNEAEVGTTGQGFRLTASVGGTLTGRGGEIIIIDDPLKGTDALSAAKREATNQWFVNTLLSRLDNKQTGAIIVVMQRVHLDDLTGFLTSQSDAWTVLSLPAIAEADERVQIGSNRWHDRQEGEALHPERDSLEILEGLRRQLGSELFSAQYQQSPIPPGGAMIKRDWIVRYKDLPKPPPPGSSIVQSWDTAAKGGASNDYSVCSTWLVTKERYYLQDVYRARMDYPTLLARAVELARQFRATRILVEDVGIGTALIADLKREGRSAIAVRPEGDKITRMAAQSAKFEAGQVYLPETAAWLAAFEAELFAFPGSKHDDQVDTVSQVLAYTLRGRSMADYL